MKQRETSRTNTKNHAKSRKKHETPRKEHKKPRNITMLWFRNRFRNRFGCRFTGSAGSPVQSLNRKPVQPVRRFNPCRESRSVPVLPCRFSGSVQKSASLQKRLRTDVPFWPFLADVGRDLGPRGHGQNRQKSAERDSGQSLGAHKKAHKSKRG